MPRTQPSNRLPALHAPGLPASRGVPGRLKFCAAGGNPGSLAGTAEQSPGRFFQGVSLPTLFVFDWKRFFYSKPPAPLSGARTLKTKTAFRRSEIIVTSFILGDDRLVAKSRDAVSRDRRSGIPRSISAGPSTVIRRESRSALLRDGPTSDAACAFAP